MLQSHSPNPMLSATNARPVHVDVWYRAPAQLNAHRAHSQGHRTACPHPLIHRGDAFDDRCSHRHWWLAFLGHLLPSQLEGLAMGPGHHDGYPGARYLRLVMSTVYRWQCHHQCTMNTLDDGRARHCLKKVKYSMHLCQASFRLLKSVPILTD